MQMFRKGCNLPVVSSLRAIDILDYLDQEQKLSLLAAYQNSWADIATLRNE